MERSPVQMEMDVGSYMPTIKEMSRVMGYRDLPESIAIALDKLVPYLDRLIEPKGGFMIFPVESSDEDTTTLDGVSLSTDKIIGRALAGASHVALFAGTIGSALEKQADEFMKSGDTLLGYLADLAGSTAAEKVASAIHARVKEVSIQNGLSAGNRYSPGYCGWDVAEQQKIFSLLPPRFCSITVTGSSMMVPVKSVSGVIPAGLRMPHRPYACGSCARKDCARRSR